MSFVYQVPRGLEPPPDTSIVLRARAGLAQLTAFLKNNNAIGASAYGIVRFVLRWDDGTERVVLLFASGLAVYVFDADTLRGAKTSRSQGAKETTLGTDAIRSRDTLQIDRAYAPLLAALLVTDLYADDNPRDAIAEIKKQWALLHLASSTGRRPLKESERRPALGLVAALADADIEQVRRMVRVMYDRELPRKQGMINFSLLPTGVRPLQGNATTWIDDSDDDEEDRLPPLPILYYGPHTDDDDDDDGADDVDADDEVNAGDADRAPREIASDTFAQTVVQTIFDLVGNNPAARSSLESLSRLFSTSFRFETPDAERDNYLDLYPDFARLLGPELPAWMSTRVDALALGRLQRAVEMYARALETRAGRTGARLMRRRGETAGALAARRSAATAAWRRAVTLLERLNGRLRFAELEAAVADSERVRRVRQWRYFTAGLRSALEHPGVRGRLPSALRLRPGVRAEMRTADELRETLAANEADERDTSIVREQTEVRGDFVRWPAERRNGPRTAAPRLEGLYYVAVYTDDTAADFYQPITYNDARYLAGDVFRSQLLVEQRETGTQAVVEPVVVYAEDMPRELERDQLFYPLFQTYLDGYQRAVLCWRQGDRIDRSAARVAGAVEWRRDWQRTLAYAPADTTLLTTLLRIGKGELAASALLFHPGVEGALRNEILADPIRAEIDQMLADGEFSSDEEAADVFAEQLNDAAESASGDQRLDALLFAVLNDPVLGQSLVTDIEARAADLFPARRFGFDLGAGILRYFYTRLLLRYLLTPIEFDLSPAINLSLSAGGAPAPFAAWETRALRDLARQIGGVLLDDPLFSGRTVAPALQVETFDALASEIDALDAAIEPIFGERELALAAGTAGAVAALRELRGAAEGQVAQTGTRGEKRSKFAVNESDDALFTLIRGVFDSDDVDDLREFYNDAAERAAQLGVDPDRAPEPVYRARQRGAGRFDVELGFDVELSDDAAIQISAFVGAATMAPAAGAEDAADWLYDSPHALVTLRGAAAQTWHTDVDPLCESEDSEGDDAPCTYYYTLLVNIGERSLTPAQGPTEFVADEDDEDDDRKVQRPLLAPNQGVLFSGLTLHRGGAAREPREPTVYMTLRRRWYRDVKREQFELIDVNL